MFVTSCWQERRCPPSCGYYNHKMYIMFQRNERETTIEKGCNYFSLPWDICSSEGERFRTYAHAMHRLSCKWKASLSLIFSSRSIVSFYIFLRHENAPYASDRGNVDGRTTFSSASRSRASNCPDYLCLLLYYDVGKVLLIKRYVLIDLSQRVHTFSRDNIRGC